MLNLTPGEEYPVCDCGGHTEHEFLGIVEEYISSRMDSGPWIKEGRTLKIYAAFKWGKNGIVLAQPKLCGNLLVFEPVAGGDSLAHCSKRLTYRFKK